MRKWIAFFVTLCFMVVAGVSIAAAPETVTIDKCQKRKPAVTFNHKKHADTLKDCKICHHKYEGKGEPNPCFKCHACTKGETPSAKQAFHKRCIKCHRKEGKGPKKCAECHKK